jgi:NADH dehydrogenase [ubiquinone] 1 alpha subcomplex assembly factor 1
VRFELDDLLETMKRTRSFRLLVSASLALVFIPCVALSEAGSSESIAEFSQKDVEALDWRIVDDRVMGGRSQGKMAISADGILSFSGNLSLENNGGFSSVRSGNVTLDLSDAKGLLVRAKGDGRNYEVHLSTLARFRGREITFVGMLPTKKGEWTEVKIPFSEFEGDFQGRRLKESTFDPSEVRRITLELVDKKPGAFELQVDWIRTYGNSKPSPTNGSSAP